jgi:hypothetical protein
MRDSALVLAQLRAARATPAPPPTVLRAGAEAAEEVGRRIVRVGDRVVLAWADGNAPSSRSDVALRHLSPARAAVFALVLGHCWPDPETEPWPGRSVGRAQLISAAADLGIDPPHVVAAMDGELIAYGLVETYGQEVRLGPAVAAWTSTEVAALRRLHARLPRGAR